MRESLQKMLDKGVDNSLLRFGGFYYAKLIKIAASRG